MRKQLELDFIEVTNQKRLPLKSKVETLIVILNTIYGSSEFLNREFLKLAFGRIFKTFGLWQNKSKTKQK